MLIRIFTGNRRQAKSHEPGFRNKTATVMAAAIVASLLAPTQAHARMSPPKTDNVTDSTPYFQKGKGRKVKNDCNRWGRLCKGYYWTMSGDFQANYYMGDVQGTFRVAYKKPIDRNRDKNRSYKIFTRPSLQIYEKREGTNRYVLRYKRGGGTKADAANGKTITWSLPLELDGKVIVVAHSPYGGQLGIKHIRLKHDDLLPDHIPQAVLMCLHDLDERQILSQIVISLAVGAVVAAAVSATGGAILPLLTGSATQAAVVTKLVQTATRAGAALAFEEVFSNTGHDDIETMESDALNMIENGSLEKLLRGKYGHGHLGCAFYSPHDIHFHWLHWNRGYGVYGNDIAKASATDGEIYLNKWDMTLTVERRT